MRVKKNNLFFLCLVCLPVVLISCSPSEQNVKAAYDRLFSHYRQSLEKDPADNELRLRFARFCYEFRDYQSVIEILGDSQGHAARLLQSKALARLHQYTRALEMFGSFSQDIDDQEALFLFAGVLEEKNLYGRALKIYEKVGPPYALQACARSEAIRSTIEQSVPRYIREWVDEAGEFIDRIKEEAAVIIRVDEQIEVNDNNTSVSTLHVVEKVLQERGKQIAEVELGYDSTYERVELEFARTITADGTIVYAGKENIRDVSKYLNFPLYSNAKAFIVSMPSVDVGAVIEYKVKVYSSKLINDDDVSIVYRLREQFPVYKAGFRLTLPAGKKTGVTFFNCDYAGDTDLKPRLEKQGPVQELSWQFQEIMPIIPEYNMPPLAEVNPAVLISSFTGWDEVYRWWSGLYKDKLTVSREMQDLVDTVCAQTDDAETRAKKIYEYVSRNIRYVGVEYGESGHEPHKAGDVFVNRYGDCKDQAILLTALLKAAGLTAAPVLIPTRDTYPAKEDFPSVNFNHAIAVVQLGKNRMFMDPTSETSAFEDLPLSDQGRTVLIFWDDRYELAQTPESMNSRIGYSMDIAIDSREDALVKRSVVCRGEYATYQRKYLKFTHPTKIRQNIENKMTDISPFARLIEYRVENLDEPDAQPELIYEFTAEKFLNPSKNLRVISPLTQIEFPPSLIAAEQRIFPVDFGGLSTKRAMVSIKLPDNLSVKYLPAGKSINTEWFSLEVRYDQQQQTIDFVQEFIVKKRMVSPADYSLFREKMKDVFYLLQEAIILEKTDDGKEGKNP